MTALARAALVLALLACAAAPARADGRAAARDHYKRGITFYDLAEYDRAIAEFKQAYELSNEPGLLFNLAQACRLKKDFEQAVHFYERYLELWPVAPNRADAEAQLARMRVARDDQLAHPPPAPLWIAPAPAPPRFASTPRGQAVIALSAIGGAAFIIAAATGGAALSVRGQYDATCDISRCDGSIYSNGRGLAVTADVMIAVGAVAAVGAIAAAAVHRPRWSGR